MNKGQWFLAHGKQDDPEDIDIWCKELAESLSSDGWEVTVISGRDDFANRCAALGGWKAWCQDIPHGVDYTGAPLYHGVIIPIDSLVETPTVGRATADIIEGFLTESKHVFSWCPDSKSFRKVSALVQMPDENWAAWSRIEFEA